MTDIIVTNLETVPGRTITQHLDIVQGNTVRAKHVGRDIMAGFKNKVVAAFLKMLFGGKLRSFESLLERARREAIVRMQREADALGADAVYNTRIEFSAIGKQPQKIGGAELLAYGTAVRYS